MCQILQSHLIAAITSDIRHLASSSQHGPEPLGHGTCAIYVRLFHRHKVSVGKLSNHLCTAQHSVGRGRAQEPSGAGPRGRPSLKHAARKPHRALGNAFLWTSGVRGTLSCSGDAAARRGAKWRRTAQSGAVGRGRPERATLGPARVRATWALLYATRR